MACGEVIRKMCIMLKKGFGLRKGAIESSREKKEMRTLLWKKIKIRFNISQKVGGIKPKMAHSWT